MLAEEDETEEEEELWSEEAGGSEREAATEAEEDDEEQGGEASDLGASSWPKVLAQPGPPGEGPRVVAWEGARPGGLEGGGLGVTCEGPLSSARKEGSGVLQLLSTVCESGEDSRASREGAMEGGGGVCGGGVEVEGGTTPVEDEDEEEEELGTGPAGAG